MSKSIKLKDNTYIDSSSVIYEYNGIHDSIKKSIDEGFIIAKKSMPSSKDLNDCWISGIYMYDNGNAYHSNSPTNDGIHILNVLNNGSGDWLIQEDYVLRWGGSAPEKYIRMKTVPGWSNWTKII